MVADTRFAAALSKDLTVNWLVSQLTTNQMLHFQNGHSYTTITSQPFLTLPKTFWGYKMAANITYSLLRVHSNFYILTVFKFSSDDTHQ